jgi:hypothetical protein
LENATLVLFRSRFLDQEKNPKIRKEEEKKKEHTSSGYRSSKQSLGICSVNENTIIPFAIAACIISSNVFLAC